MNEKMLDCVIIPFCIKEYPQTIRIHKTMDLSVPLFIQKEQSWIKGQLERQVYRRIDLVSRLFNNDNLMAACPVLSQPVKIREGRRKLNKEERRNF